MRTPVWIGAAVALIASAAMTTAQELDSKAQRGLDRARKTADKLETDLAVYERGERNYSDSVGERAADKLDKAAETLAELPGEHPEVAAAQARLDALRERVARLVAERGSLGARSGLDDKTAGKLNHAATTLENLQTELNLYGPEGKYTYNDRVAERFARKLDQAGDKLAELPAENSLVAMLGIQLEQLRAQLARMGQGLEQAQAQAAALAQARADLLASPDYARDLELARGFYDALIHTGLLEYGAAYLRRPYRTPDLGVAEAYASQFQAVREGWPRLAETYAPLRGGRPNDMMFLLRDGARFFPAYVETLQGFADGAAAHLDGLQAELDRLVQGAVEARDHEAFSRPDSPLNRALAQVRHVADLAAILGGDEALPQRANAITARVHQATDALSAAIVANNRAPQNAYTGDDADALRAFTTAQWAEHFPDERILAIRMPNDPFRRVVAWRWDRIEKQVYKVDHSELWIRVIVAAADGEAILYHAVLRKLHLEADRLTIAWDRPDVVAPSDRMRVENLE